MDCGSDTLGSNPARFILEFCFLNNWIDLDSHAHFTEQNIQETEISCTRKVRCVVRATERKLSFWSMQMSTKLKTAYFFFKLSHEKLLVFI